MSTALRLPDPGAEVQRALADLIGVPYLDRGRTREGADCFGLVALAQRRLYDLDLPDYVGAYASAEEESEVARAIRGGLRSWRSVSPVTPGDVVLCWYTDPALPSHLGIYVGGRKMLSTRSASGARIEDLSSAYWRSRVVDYLRHESRFPDTFEVYVLDAKGGVARQQSFPLRTSLLRAVEAMGLGAVDEGHVRVLIGRAAYDEPAAWSMIYPKRGTRVVLRHVPGAPLIPVLIALGSALAAAVPGAGALAGLVGSLTFGLPIGIATALEVGAVLAATAVAGFGLVSSIMGIARGPDQPDAGGVQGPDASPTLNGVGNEMRPHQPIPEHFGDLTFFPDLAAPVWTEFVGEERWATAIFVVGEGRYEIPEHEIEIGGIPWKDITGAELRIAEGGVFGDYVEETTTEVDPTPGPNQRPAAYWRMDSGANHIAGGPALTASAGAAFNDPVALIASGGKSGNCNGGYFSTASLVLDWTQDWAIDLWARSTFPGSEETLLSVGTTNPIEIVKSEGRRGVYVRIGSKKYGSAMRPNPWDDSVVEGVGHWGVGQTDFRGNPRNGISHVVVKYRRADGRLVAQIDGADYLLGTGIAVVQPTGTRVVVGGDASLSPARRWSDRIDEVVIWPRFVTDSEAAQRTAAGVQGAGATRQPTFDVYRDTVLEVPVNERFEQADSTKHGDDTISPFVTRSINGVCTQLGIDIWFDGLYRRNEVGDRRDAVVAIVVHYRPDGATEWARAQDAAGFHWVGGGGASIDHTDGSIVLKGYVQDSFPLMLRWNVPLNDGYEMRLLRFEPIAYSEAHNNNRRGGGDYGGGTTDFSVLAFRGARPGAPPLNAPGVSTFTLRLPLRAVGNQLGRVQCRAKRKLPIYDPIDPEADPATGMTPARVTRSAAWAGLHVLRGNPRPCDDELINFDEIADFATRAQPCDLRVDFASNKFDAFNMIMKPSRATLDLDQDGRFTVAEDRAQAVPSALFTQRNIRGFRGAKFFFDLPHALLVDWWDARGNKKQMKVYADGFSARGEEEGAPETVGTVAATKFESIEVRGLVEEALVWEYARIELRKMKFRDEQWRFELPIEFLPLRRGMRAELQHPAMLVGRKSGTVIRVDTSGANATAIRIDEKIIYNAGESYGIRWRDAVNVQHLTEVVNPATVDPIESDVLTLETPIAIASAPKVEDLVAFGLIGQETVSAMLDEINPLDEWTAEIVCFPYHDDIYLPGDVPVDIDPIVTPRPELPHAKAPAVPGIARISSDARWLIRAGVEVLSRARVLIAAGANGREPAAYFQLRWKPVGSPHGWQYGAPFSADVGMTFAEGLNDGLLYEFQARAYSVAGVTSIFSGSVRHRVIGKSAPPPNVTDVRLEGDKIVWSYPGLDEVVDLDGFRVRYRYGNTLPMLWGQGIAAHRGVRKTSVFPVNELPRDNRALTVMVKAVDVAGHESVEAGLLVLGALSVSAQRNVTLNREESVLGWPGEQLDCAEVGGKLEPLEALPFAWKKRPITDRLGEIAGTFDYDTVREFPVIEITGGPAVIDDARGDFYFWFDADGRSAFTRISAQISPTQFVLAKPYRGAATSGAGTIHRIAYATDDRAGAWSLDPTQKAWAQRYQALRYTATLTPDGFDLGDEIRLSIGVTPHNLPHRISYAQQGPVPAWSGNPKRKVWGDPTRPAWSGYGPYRPWPGSLTPRRRVSYRFRVDFEQMRGDVPPTLDFFTIIADVPDRTQNLNDVPISAEGTRLYLATPFRFIRNVLITLQESGTAAVRWKVIDKSPAGPLVELYDAAGARVAGSVDAQIIGA